MFEEENGLFLEICGVPMAHSVAAFSIVDRDGILPSMHVFRRVWCWYITWKQKKNQPSETQNQEYRENDDTCLVMTTVY